jgi:formylglycine-generating enzyme required for sulfatase activity
MKFCQWLSIRERKKYRLPTEAEWEYAAKGTDGRRYPWGNFDKRGDLANFADKNTSFAWSDRQIDDGYAESAPVGSFPRGASPFGIEDMSGNVWEWCSNFFEQYKPTPKIDPHGPPSGTKRVYRGGSWKSRFASLRTTARSTNLPNFSCNDLGFRIVCECDS